MFSTSHIRHVLPVILISYFNHYEYQEIISYCAPYAYHFTSLHLCFFMLLFSSLFSILYFHSTPFSSSILSYCFFIPYLLSNSIQKESQVIFSGIYPTQVVVVICLGQLDVRKQHSVNTKYYVTNYNLFLICKCSY